MCFTCSPTILTPVALPMTRRDFSRGFAGAAALPTVLSLRPFGCWEANAQPTHSSAAQTIASPSNDLLATLEDTYKDIHANPELAMQEHRTAGIAAKWLRQNGFEVTENVGGTGVVGILRNGEGSTVLLRADMDALPMKENTGLPYASKQVVTDLTGQETPVAHSCGHDMHVTWLMGATGILAANQERWRGTIIAVFQPAEETGEGARAMVAGWDGPALSKARHCIGPARSAFACRPHRNPSRNLLVNVG